MPAIAMSLWKCTAYIVRAIVLLVLLVEAYSFINPSNYSAYYDTLWSRRNEGYLSLILAALEDMMRLVFKVVSFCLSFECALWILGGDWGTAEVDTPREWGMVYYLDLPIGVYAFRWAISRDTSVATWFIWYHDLLNWVMELLIGLADGVGNGVVAG